MDQTRTAPNTPPRQTGLAATCAPSSQPFGSTERALEASLTGNVIFNNKAIVNAVFEPSKAADQTVKDILAKINENQSLKSACDKVLHGKLAEGKKYQPMLTLLKHMTTYNHQDGPLTNNDYARHATCGEPGWILTVKPSATDPDIYPPRRTRGRGI